MTGRRWFGLILTGLVAARAGAATSATPATPVLTGLALVEAHNARELGSPGWRRVKLELKTGAQVTRTFEVINLWRREASGVRTLFVLESPEGLRGTNYLLVENPTARDGMKVFLHLPAGKRRVLSIQPSNFDEGLLGSDFGYRDLTMTLPTAGYRFTRTGEAVIAGAPAWLVRAEPVSAEARSATAWSRTTLFFAQDSGRLIGTDAYTADDLEQPRKSLRVLGWRQIDKAWIQTLMVMTGQEGRSSVLTLEDARFGLTGLDPRLFVPETLPDLSETVLRDHFSPVP